ncbi:hypothetical protein ACJX0J_034479, partial [Zea mays]
PRTATRTGGDAVTCRDLYENRKSLLTAMTCEKNSGLWSALEWLGTSAIHVNGLRDGDTHIIFFFLSFPGKKGACNE